MLRYHLLLFLCQLLVPELANTNFIIFINCWSLFNSVPVLCRILVLLILVVTVVISMIHLGVTSVHGYVAALLLSTVNIHLGASCKTVRVIYIGWASLDFEISVWLSLWIWKLVILNPNWRSWIQWVTLELVLSTGNATDIRWVTWINLAVYFLDLRHFDLLFLLGPSWSWNFFNKCHFILLSYRSLTLLPLT